MADGTNRICVSSCKQLTDHTIQSGYVSPNRLNVGDGFLVSGVRPAKRSENLFDANWGSQKPALLWTLNLRQPPTTQTRWRVYDSSP